MSFSVVVYRCQNLGDMTQTVALTRLLPQAHGVYRHRLTGAPADRTLVLNGMLAKTRRPGPACRLACWRASAGRNSVSRPTSVG